MATTGITFSGFNGIDFDQIISLIMQQESQPLLRLQAEEKAHKDKDAAFVELGGHISKFQTAVAALLNPSSFTGVAAASTDASILDVTVGSSAIAGHYELNVTALAKAQVTSSTNGYAAITDVAADGGTLSFTINGETTEAITVTAATTLAQLRDQINSQNSAVAASIINTGSANHLVISSRETGAAGGFVIHNALTNSGGTAVAFAAGQSSTSGNAQNAQDAAFTVNGIAVTSASNTVSTALPGLSVTLKKLGAVSVDAVPDRNSLKESVRTLVSEFNELKRFYDKSQSRDPNGTAAPLNNDAILRQVYLDIRRTLLGANDNPGDLDYLAEIGIEFTSNGELKFVEARFDEAIGSRLTEVQQLFQGENGVGGLFRSLDARLDSLDATSGVIKTARSTLEHTLQRHEDRIEAMELRLELRRQELVKVYAAADKAMTRMNQSVTSLSSITNRFF
jgi:flagellar hook-associated protein 2